MGDRMKNDHLNDEHPDLCERRNGWQYAKRIVRHLREKWP